MQGHTMPNRKNTQLIKTLQKIEKNSQKRKTKIDSTALIREDRESTTR